MDLAAQDRVVELLQSGRIEAALLLLERHLEVEPRDWYALYMSGVALRGLGHYGKAVDRLTNAISVKADEAPVHLALGIALQLSGRLDDAVSSLLSAIRLKPNLYEAYNSLGVTYKRKGRYKEALDAYEQAVDRLMASVSADVHSDPGRCYRYEMVSGEQVRTVLPYVFVQTRAILQSNPLYSILTNNRAACLEELGRIVEAQELYKEAIEFIPDGYNYPDPYRNLQRIAGESE